MSSNSGGLIGLLISFGVASAVGFFAMAALMVLGDWTLLQALFAAAVIFFVLGGLLAAVFSKPLPGPVEPGTAGTNQRVAAAPAPAPTAVSQPAPAPKPAPAPAAPAKAAPPPKPVEAAPTPKPKPEPKATPKPAPAPAPAPAMTDGEGTRPEALDGPRGGQADDLKKIKGVGPKLEGVLHGLGFYHFDQVANWTSDEIAWVDQNLEGFKGRVSRDNWVDQAKQLAAGAETEFSRKVDKGDVY